MENNQTSSIDIPKRNSTRIVASTSDGHVTLSSINTNQGEETHHQGMNTETGISPTYYTTNGTIVQTSKSQNNCPFGSPCFDDSSRVFFSHNSNCSCK
jgi:hypothetical protein